MRRFYTIGFIAILLLTYSCKLSRFVVYNFANITDYKIFPSNPIQNQPDTIFQFPYATTQSSFDNFKLNGVNTSFDKQLKDNETVAFLIIHNDSIKYERYFDEYNESSIVASFSMAKSVTSLLIGCAIDDKLIHSIEEPITNYIPELKKDDFSNIKIKHLLQMTTGIRFNESYFNPFGDAATFYYGTNLTKAIKSLKIEASPGSRFKYSSGDTQLLGFVLKNALKSKTISQYLEEKIWKPLGMEYDASWSLDTKNGVEKTFCCLNARAKDFAKLGRLYLHKGNWNGQQIVSKSWIENSTKLDKSEGSVWYYQNQWWLPSQDGDFVATGILGQYIYVHPHKNLIIVRLGKNQGNIPWEKIFMNLAKSYNL